jgi:hypothetical protein
MVHLHALDESTREPVYKAGIYARMIHGIRPFKGPIICVSLSERDSEEFGQRSEILQMDGDLKPDTGPSQRGVDFSPLPVGGTKPGLLPSHSAAIHDSSWLCSRGLARIGLEGLLGL